MLQCMVLAISAAVGPQVRWVAPPSCPSAQEVRAEIEARVPPEAEVAVTAVVTAPTSPKGCVCEADLDIPNAQILEQECTAGTASCCETWPDLCG